METKKTAQADIERLRTRGFIIGLAIAIAAFIVALEFSVREDSGDIDSDFLDEIAEDMDFMPPIEENLPPEPDKLAPVVSDEMVVVDNSAQLTAQDDEEAHEVLAIEDEVPTEEEEQPAEAIPVEEAEEEEVKPLRVLEQLPQFPGGMRQLMVWLTKNLKYPEAAKNQKTSGKVVVAFIVNADGTVVDVKLIQAVDPLLDREALRVARMMPKWEPGISDGKPCRTLVHMPVVFKL